MKVFVSWSGEQSREIAREIKSWLPLVLHYVEPWMSASDIDAGDRWATEVAIELEKCVFGILCLTPDNLASAWIYFEAGALSKQIEQSAVVPFLFHVDYGDITGPLAQFQAKKFDYDSTYELISAINAKSDQKIQEDRVKVLFDMAWPRLEESIETIPAPKENKEMRRSQREVMNDLVRGMRVIEQRTRVLDRAGIVPLEMELQQVEDWRAQLEDIAMENKVRAIKLHRKASGLGLKESKNIVEKWIKQRQEDEI